MITHIGTEKQPHILRQTTMDFTHLVQSKQFKQITIIQLLILCVFTIEENHRQQKGIELNLDSLPACGIDAVNLLFDILGTIIRVAASSIRHFK